MHRKVALVTGGAVRVGKAIVLGLAKTGYDVCIHYGRSADAARQTQQEAAAYGVRAEIISANLADLPETKKVIPAAQEKFGRIDVLVNNAAIFLSGGLADTTAEMWQKQMAINLRAPYFLIQAFAAQAHFSGDLPGQIINISDARVNRPGTDYLAYRLTKSALITLTHNLALELAPNITVNALALGAILPPPEEDEAYLQKIAQERIPLRRHGNAEIVAQNVLHLLDQPFITGQVLRLDGGEFL